MEQYNADIFTVVANLTGHPALSIPNGLGSDNLPTGFQLVGRMFEEERLLDIAKEINPYDSRLSRSVNCCWRPFDY